MREIRSSGSVRGVMRNHDPYRDCQRWNYGFTIVLFESRPDKQVHLDIRLTHA
jgi:hypothetical protein